MATEEIPPVAAFRRPPQNPASVLPEDAGAGSPPAVASGFKPETLAALQKIRRARKTPRYVAAFSGLCLANFLVFAVGWHYVYAHGERVTPAHADDPNVLVAKSIYYRVSPGMYRYVKIHERITMILFLPVLPLACYGVYRRLS